MNEKSLLAVGWREFIGLPDLGLDAIKAKVDTGARTSALHAFRIEEFERDGRTWARFWIHPLRKHRSIVRICEAPVADRRTVSDSGGHRQDRVVIETKAQIGPLEGSIEITLTDRDRMLFPMLLGRTAMAGRLYINPASSYLLGRDTGRRFRRHLLSNT